MAGVFRHSGRHLATDETGENRLRRVAIVGSPNVGKSVVFNNLTGAYVTVSNYPGTTVEVARGKGRIGGQQIEVIDTPGMYSLVPITEEERVARRIVLEEATDLVLHVTDAKNLDRMLPFTLQLVEAGLPVVLVVNMMDEARREGISLQQEVLEERLGIPVLTTVATTGEGMKRLRQEISGGEQPNVTGRQPARNVNYGEQLEGALGELERLLDGNHTVSRRATALLLLQGDRDTASRLRETQGCSYDAIRAVADRAAEETTGPLSYRIAMARQRSANEILREVVTFGPARGRALSERLSHLMTNPWTGVPILLLVVYYVLYQFVGVFGAGTLVRLLEGKVFDGLVNPFFDRLIEAWVPWKVLQDLLVHDYGLLTLGLRYSFGIILPIVGTFFLVFSVLEDSGYLPRLASLIDRLFKKIGLNGRAVIPMVLGLGCDTMATMVTRTLETVRERVIATLLLALAVPCSAQLGVMLAILGGRPAAFWVWLGVVGLNLLFVGYLAARAMPGRRPTFFLEFPPLRLPKLTNVVVKTYARMKWYLLEVLPLFLAASVLIWLGNITGAFQWTISLLAPLARALGLPAQMGKVFLFGFFRRDYGAAGLYDLQSAGLLSGNQLVVAAVTLTLFVPCVANFMMMVKERGTKTAVGMFLFILPYAFLAGFALSLLLRATGVQL